MHLNSESYDYGYEKFNGNFYGCYDQVDPHYAQQLHNAIAPQSHYNAQRYVSPYDRTDKRHTTPVRSGTHSISPPGNTTSLLDSAKQYGIYDPIAAAASPALSSTQASGNTPPSDFHSSQHPPASGYPVQSLTPTALPKSGYPVNDTDFSASSPGGCKIPPAAHNGVGPTAGSNGDMYNCSSSLPSTGSPVSNLNSLAGGLSGSSNQATFLSSMGSMHHQQPAGAPQNFPIYSWMRQGSGKYSIFFIYFYIYYNFIDTLKKTYLHLAATFESLHKYGLLDLLH